MHIVLFLCLFLRVEAEFVTKLKELEEKHAKEIAELSASSGPDDAGEAAVENVNAAAEIEPNAEDEERERKQAKARRKREKAKEKERELELQIERENAEAGPSMRQIEVEQIQNQLAPLGLQIAEIPSDGNCLYRAVAAHCGNTYQETRKCDLAYYQDSVSDFHSSTVCLTDLHVPSCLFRECLRRYSIKT